LVLFLFLQRYFLFFDDVFSGMKTPSLISLFSCHCFLILALETILLTIFFTNILYHTNRFSTILKNLNMKIENVILFIGANSIFRINSKK